MRGSKLTGRSGSRLLLAAAAVALLAVSSTVGASAKPTAHQGKVKAVAFFGRCYEKPTLDDFDFSCAPPCGRNLHGLRPKLLD